VRELARKYGIARPTKRTKRTMAIGQRASSVVVSPYRGPVPNVMFTTLRYAENFVLNPGVASNAQYVFSANGMYDPNITGVGHQPRGFDQMMAFYGRYYVNGCKITLSCANPGTLANSENVVVSVFPSNTSTATVTNPWDAIEPKGCQWITFSVGGTDGTTTKPNFKLNNYVNINSWKGNTTNDDDSMSGDASNNPGYQVYWIINMFGDGGTDLPATNFIVELEYYAMFKEIKNLAQS